MRAHLVAARTRQPKNFTQFYMPPPGFWHPNHRRGLGKRSRRTMHDFISVSCLRGVCRRTSVEPAPFHLSQVSASSLSLFNTNTMSTPCCSIVEGILTIRQPPKPSVPTSSHAQVTHLTFKRITPSTGVSVVPKLASQRTRDRSICTPAFSGSKHASKPNSTKRSVIFSFRSVSIRFDPVLSARQLPACPSQLTTKQR